MEVKIPSSLSDAAPNSVMYSTLLCTTSGVDERERERDLFLQSYINKNLYMSKWTIQNTQMQSNLCKDSYFDCCFILVS